jgi:transcription-repair coupling factor (superfamily II helicase)
MKNLVFFLLVATAITMGIYLTPKATAQQSNASPDTHFAAPAQSVPYQEFEQHGNLVDMRIVPGDKETRFYVIGKEAAKLKKFSLTGQAQSGDKVTDLKLKKFNDYYVTQDKIEGQTLHMKAQMENSEANEEFHINLKKH